MPLNFSGIWNLLSFVCYIQKSPTGKFNRMGRSSHSGLARVLWSRKALSAWSALTSTLCDNSLLKPRGMLALSLPHQHPWPVPGLLFSPCLTLASLMHLKAEDRKAESYVQLDKSTHASRGKIWWWWTALRTTHWPARDSGTIKQGQQQPENQWSAPVIALDSPR